MNDNIKTDDDHDAPCDDRVDVPYWIEPQINDADAREGGESR